MGLFAPFAVQLSARWGIERTIAYSLLLIGAATATRVFADHSALLLATAFLAGIGIAVAGPLLSGFVKRHFADNATAMVGVYSMSLVLGAAISSGMSVPFENLLGGSWRGSLSLWAVLASAALPVWYVLARKEKRISASSGRTVPVGSRIPWSNGRAWLLTLFFGLMGTMFYSMAAWLAPIVESMGYGKTAAGAVLTLFMLVQIPVSMLLPVLVSRYPKRLVWLLSLAGLEMTGIALLLTGISPWVAAVLLGIGAGGLFPMALMLPIDETDSAEAAGAWSALTQFGGYIISSLGPFFTGWLHDLTGGYTGPLSGLAIATGLMMVVQIAIGNKKVRSIGASNVSGSRGAVSQSAVR
jgi:CP family cyanate transporter-like MFS transporter